MKLHREYIKNYKKNTLAILLSMVMTIALAVCLLIVTHTDNHIQSLTEQYIRGAYDIAFKKLTPEQIKRISSDNRLKYIELSKYLYSREGKEKQEFAVIAANKDYVLERTKILKGRMPENKKEIIGEAWCFKNLEVKPKPGSKLTVKVTDPYNSNEGQKTVTYKVVGIISDNAANKTYGGIAFYTKFKDDYEQAGLFLKYKSGVNVKKEGKEIKSRFRLKDKQMQYNYPVGDYEYYQSKSNKINLFTVLLLLGVCTIVIAGVYRISLMNRSSQYGILRAVGMQKRQIRKLIAAELYEIYLASIPIGAAAGFVIALLISWLTRDKTMQLVFWGKDYAINLDIPIVEIMLCISGVGLIVGVIVFITSHMINRKTAIAIIHGGLSYNNDGKHALMTSFFNKTEKPYKAIALKYVFQDIKSTIFVVLSFSIGACLFVGLFYQAGLTRTMNGIDKQYYFYNGDFKLQKNYDDLLTTGFSKYVLKSIQKIKGVEEINTQRALPIRVIDDKKIARDKAYFHFFDRGASKGNFSFDSYEGNDGTDQFYLSELKAYNESALKHLRDYVIQGDYNPKHMKKNSAVMFMPMTIAKNDWRRSQNYFKSGYYVMDYKVGDEVTFKYRADFKTNVKKYYKFMDKDARYIYKKFRIAAIVYYPYMRQVSNMANAYPSLIISEEQMKKIHSEEAFDSIALSVDKSLGAEYLKHVYNKLVGLTIKNQGASAISIIDETRDMDNLYRKQLIYSYGIAFVVLLLASINIVNNLKYRIYIRKKEISIYRAIGVKHDMICKMIRLENMILGGIASIITCIASFPITLALYKRSQISYLQIGYHNDIKILAAACILILIICNVVSRVITKELRGGSIVENINVVE